MARERGPRVSIRTAPLPASLLAAVSLAAAPPVVNAPLDGVIEGGVPGGGTSGDRHLLIVDRDRRLLCESFATRWNASLQRWEADSGAVWNLDENGRRPEGWTSADAAGLAILPGLVRAANLAPPRNLRIVR